MKILTGVLVHRVPRPLRGSVSWGSGWSVPCVSIQLTLSQSVASEYSLTHSPRNHSLVNSFYVTFHHLHARLEAADPAVFPSSQNHFILSANLLKPVSQSVFHGPAPRSPLHRLAVRLRHSRSNTSTEYSLPGATQAWCLIRSHSQRIGDISLRAPFSFNCRVCTWVSQYKSFKVLKVPLGHFH